MLVEIGSVYDGWSDVLSAFRTDSVVRVPSRHGVTFDIPGLNVVVREPTDTRVPKDYPLPEIVKDYRERLFGDQRDNSLFYQRMTAWRPTPKSRSQVDQFDKVMSALRHDQNSRAAIISLWNPLEDVESDHPVSPISATFRIVGDELNLMVIARSIDVWTGIVPELLAFSQFLTDTSFDLGMRKCVLRYYAFSAHIYEADYISSVQEPTG